MGDSLHSLALIISWSNLIELNFNLTQSNSIHGLSSIEFDNRAKSNLSERKNSIESKQTFDFRTGDLCKTGVKNWKLGPECSVRVFRKRRNSAEISEDVRRLSKTFEEDPKMFRWYTNEFKYILRDKFDISEIIDIFACEDIISSHVKISYRFYQFVPTRHTTDFKK